MLYFGKGHCGSGAHETHGYGVAGGYTPLMSAGPHALMRLHTHLHLKAI